jgi:hypothetical protein
MAANYGTTSPSLLVDPNALKNTDAYKFRFDQGMNAVNRSNAAAGMRGSGNALAELAKFGQGLASTEYDNEFNRQRAMNLDNDARFNMQQQMLSRGAENNANDVFRNRQFNWQKFSADRDFGANQLERMMRERQMQADNDYRNWRANESDNQFDQQQMNGMMGLL